MSAPLSPANPLADNPIGVFDSGVGGLSVLRQLLRQLPQEDFVYLADSAWAPYGERSPEQIEERCLQIADYLQRQYHIKALVVACNTATSQAMQQLRARWPDLLLVGIEPAIKPAVAMSRTGHIGIMATRGTVQSAKFSRLLRDWGGKSHIHVQACDGLALAIENALEHQSNPDGQTVQSLCRRYVHALREASQNTAAEQADQSATAIDVLVLGCTHYPFAAEILQQVAGDAVQLIEPGEPVARQTQRLLLQHALQSSHAAQGCLTLLATSSPQRLQRAAQQWLGISADVVPVDIA